MIPHKQPLKKYYSNGGDNTTLLKRAYGRLPKFKKKRDVKIEVTAISYTKPDRQISLEQAIKKKQEGIKKEKAQKAFKRKQRIERIRKGISRFQ